MIDRSTIDRIFAAADIVEVVGDFVSLTKKGVNYSACCPFHSEKTPSFVVSPSKGLYKCFGCGKAGNAVNFVMEHEKLLYPDALRWLAKKYSIEIVEKELSPEQKQQNDDRESMMVVNSYAAQWFEEQIHTPKGEAIGLSYMRERGFSDATIKQFGIGYNPEGGDTFSKEAIKIGYQEKFLIDTGLTIIPERGGYYDRFNGRVMFPIHSLSGRVIGFGGRTLRSDKKTAKYLNSPESIVYHKGQTLYGLWQAKKSMVEHDYCILVEGYMDVMRMHQSGICNTVASSGTALTREQVVLIRRFTRNVTVIYDGDPAGIKASLRGIDILLTEGMNVRAVLMPEGDDPDSFARDRSSEQIRQFIETTQQDFVGFKAGILSKDAGDDPIKRAALITDIIQTIALVPEAVDRAMFVRECSRVMDVSEQLLSDEVARRRLSKIDGQQWINSIKKSSGRAEVTGRTHQGYDKNASRSGEGYNAGYENGRAEVLEFNPASRGNIEAQDDYYDPSHDMSESNFGLLDKLKINLDREITTLEDELLSYVINYTYEFFELNSYEPQLDMESEQESKFSVAMTIVEELERDQLNFRGDIQRQTLELYAALLKEQDNLSCQDTFLPENSNDEIADNFDNYDNFGNEATETSSILTYDQDQLLNQDRATTPQEQDPDNSTKADNKHQMLLQRIVAQGQPEVVEYVTNHVFEHSKYVLSLLWDKNEVAQMSLHDRLSIAIPRALDTYKHKIVNIMIQDLMAEIQIAEADKQLELLMRIKQLNELKNSICKQYDRIN